MRVEEIDALLGGEAQRLADKYRSVPVDFMDGYGWAVTQICRLYHDAVPVEWISCTERLPCETGDYLVTCADKYDTWTSVAEYSKARNQWCAIGTVIAWAPLPEPYVVRF